MAHSKDFAKLELDFAAAKNALENNKHVDANGNVDKSKIVNIVDSFVNIATKADSCDNNASASESLVDRQDYELLAAISWAYAATFAYTASDSKDYADNCKSAIDLAKNRYVFSKSQADYAKFLIGQMNKILSYPTDNGQSPSWGEKGSFFLDMPAKKQSGIAGIAIALVVFVIALKIKKVI